MLAEILSDKTLLKDFQLAHTFPVIGRRPMLLNARRLEQKNWKRAEKELVETVITMMK